MKKLYTGAAIVDITPQKPMFLHGYPHVERISEGINDPLFASALIIDNEELQIGFCSVDVIFISKEITNQVRKRVSESTGIPLRNLMISATHTHSGPVTFSDIFYDPVVPEADPEYISFLIDKLVEVYTQAFKNKRESKIAITTANVNDVGGNRREVSGTMDNEVSILVLKDLQTNEISTLSVIYSMHPTVLHQDSKLISADFPGYTREYIKNKLGNTLKVLYHTGPSGNQSPRHFVNSKTFDEAKRLGYLLGEGIIKSVELLSDDDFYSWVSLNTHSECIMLPKREFMSVEDAEVKRIKAKEKYERLKENNASIAEIRTAEVDWFGSEENKQLSEMAGNGKLDKIYQSVLPAEISMISIDKNNFIFLPGEIFVEYSLTIKEKNPNTYVVSLSNGVLAGYLVTEEAEKEGGYEASNSIFPSSAGKVLVEKVLSLLKNNNMNIPVG